MAYTVSPDFKNKIKDGITQQRGVILFSDLYFTDEDIQQDGIVVSETFSTNEHLSFGICPSATLSFKVLSNGLLSGYEFGTASVYVGVQISTSAFTMPSGTSAYIMVGDDAYTASASGVFCNGARISSGKFVSLLYDGVSVYAFGQTFSLKIDPSDQTFTQYVPHRFMVQKMQSAKSVAMVLTNGIMTGANIWHEDYMETYEFVPLGVFEVEKPTKTITDVIAIQDAYDRMKWFDIDASEYLGGLTYPITLGEIFTSLCDYVEVPYASDTFPYSTVSYANSPFSDTSCSCRDILSWIAERARKVAKFDRTGRLAFEWIGDEIAEELTTSDIGMDDYDCAEYHTEAVTGVLLKGSNGASLSFGDMENPYTVMGNPFVPTITNEELAEYEAIPEYVPMTLRILSADPSIDVGDMLSVASLADAYQMLADIYNSVWVVPVGESEFRLHAKSDGTVLMRDDGSNIALGQYHQQYEVLTVPADKYIIPLIERTITYQGRCSAIYEATGERWREVDSDSTIAYNASVAPKIAEQVIDRTLTQQDVFNRLTNNGEQQGIYLQDGKIYINAEYIRAGTISADYIYGGTLSGMSINIGDGAFRVYANGSVSASNLNITNGSINVNATSPLANWMRLTASYSEQTYRMTVGAEKIQSYWASEQGFEYYGNYGASAILITKDGRNRIYLDETGLYFYNASGTLTKSYPAT